MLGHPDADALAACREGLLGKRRLARIRAHLARCPRCASLDQELAAVSTLLASAPVPRIPDELAARLDTVLAAESAARARGESPAADGIPAAPDGIPPATDGIPAIPDRIPAAATDVPADASKGTGPAGWRPGRADKAGARRGQPRSARPVRPWRVTALRAASVTAVLLVIAGGGYGVSRLLQTGSGASSSAASGSSAPGEHNPGVRAPGSAGAGSASGPDFQPAIKTPAGGPLVVHSGTSYQPDQLAAQARRVLAHYRASSPAHAPASASGSASAMAGCAKLVPGGARLSLMDEAHYGGQLATVIMQAPAGGQPGRAWVIVPRCSATSPRLVAQTPLPGSG